MTQDWNVTGADMIGDSRPAFGGQLELKVIGMDLPGTVEHGQTEFSSYEWLQKDRNGRGGK